MAEKIITYSSLNDIIPYFQNTDYNLKSNHGFQDNSAFRSALSECFYEVQNKP